MNWSMRKVKTRKTSEFPVESGSLVCNEYITPTIIRFPFEKLAREHSNISLIRLSRSKAMVPASLGERAVGISADMARSIADIAAGLTEARKA